MSKKSDIIITINNMQRKFKLNEPLIKKMVLSAISLIKGVKGDLEINFISLEKIKKYNEEYRGIKKATDVLSFNFTDIYSDDGGVLLIAPSWILKNGVKKNEMSSEVALLLVHGLLHLSGEDHPDGHVDDSPMGEMQSEILDLIMDDLKKDLVVCS
jgi:rRNA maturation RNase YbeY